MNQDNQKESKTAEEMYWQTVHVGQKCYPRDAINLMEEYAAQETSLLREEVDRLKALLKESMSAINYVQMAEQYENQDLIKSADKAWDKVHEFKNKVTEILNPKQ